jgi:peptidoglycan/LPS O-acetylase OafA/YrhL
MQGRFRQTMAAASPLLPGRAPVPVPGPPGPAGPSGPRGLPSPADGAGGGFRFGYRPELDGLRGVAVATVAVYHFGKIGWLDGEPWLVPGGQSGLDLFFVLSGFLITTLLLDELRRFERVDAGRFLWRRVLRLVPALTVMMAGFLAVSFVGERHEPSHLLSSTGWVLGFMTNLAIDRPIEEVSHTWSLSVEAHFYLIWCLVTLLVTARARRPHRALALVAGAGAIAVAVNRAVAYGSGDNVYGIYLGTPYRLDAPLIGALAGIALSAGWLDAIPRRAAAWAGGVGVALFGVAAYQTRGLAPWMFNGGYTAVALCAAVVVVAPQLAGGGRVRAALRTRPLVALGKISYSLYLWHLPLYVWLARNAGPWPVAVKAVVGLGASLGVATLSYRFVEQPFLRRKARLAPTAAPVSTATSNPM